MGKGNIQVLRIFGTEMTTLYSFCQDNFSSRRPRVAIFADIIKIVTMFINIIFLDPKKVKTIRNYISKRSLYLYFLTQQNLLISGEKKLMSAEL